MSSTTTKPKVIIIGAGIGGLTLAKFLDKNGYPYEIYERDESDHSRYQGWAIAIRWYLDKLASVAPPSAPDLETVSVLAGTGLETVYSMFTDGKSDALVKIQGRKNLGIRANRLKLRKWLLIDIPVHWNTNFEDYEVGADDKIIVKFKDGSTTTGDILVGADGTMSHVRSQLYAKNIGEMAPHVSVAHLANVCGEVTLDKAGVDSYLKYGSGFVLANTSNPPVRFFFGLKEMSPDKTFGHFYFLFFFPDNNEDPNHWTNSKDKEMLHKRALEMSKHLNPDFQSWLAATKPENIMAPLVLRDMIPQVGPHGHVTLIGDAAHPMTPFRGEGGNNAIEDGIELFEAIHAANGDYDTALREFEKKMVPRAEASVRESHRASMDFTPKFAPSGNKGISMKS